MAKLLTLELDLIDDRERLSGKRFKLQYRPYSQANLSEIPGSSKNSQTCEANFTHVDGSIALHVASSIM